jgi:Tol biopolymer transport system component
MSSASTLVPGDTNELDDVFLHDRLTGKTERISVSTEEREGNGPTWISGYASRRISDDGRFITFTSSASNLVAGDTNNGPDVFVRDRVTKTTIRISVSSAGGQASVPRGTPWSPSFASMSSTGRYLVFDSSAPNLGPGDRGDDWDIFVHDLVTRTTALVTLDGSGGDLEGQVPVISADGRTIAYVAGVTDREGATTGTGRVYVYEAPRLR